MQILPHFPLPLNVMVLFGLTLLLGLIGGECTRYSKFVPRITGYLIVGFLVGPYALHLVTPEVMTQANIFVDIALGLILFNLGRHLDFAWLRQDHGLWWVAVMQSGLIFLLIFSLLIIFHFSWLEAMSGATLVMASSPAILMMVANDLGAVGPVTRRAFILTSLNNLFALIVFTLVLPLLHALSAKHFAFWPVILYRFFGSLLVSGIFFIVTQCIARWIGKRKESQFVLLIAMVVLTIGLTPLLNLSSMLTLFMLGVCARNFDKRHVLLEVDFGWLARLFFILLFVITGASLQFNGFHEFAGIMCVIIVLRLLAHFLGLWIFTQYTRLTWAQNIALTMTLTPMASVAFNMVHKAIYFNAELDPKLLPLLTAIFVALNIIGPIICQIAFIKSGEAAP